jgi:hypothetical protein
VRLKAYGLPNHPQIEIEMSALEIAMENEDEHRRQLEPGRTTLKLTVLNTAPKRDLGLLDLPGEIRNKIYRYALISTAPINGIETKIPAIWLLATSRGIHEEASSIFYEENTFTFGLQIHWTKLPEIVLAGFPRLEIWPTPRYHEFLKKLHIKFEFNSGDSSVTRAPEILQKSMHAMRAAYDHCWDNLGKYSEE